MDEKRANIDLAFRNGLKDYEVLPPADVWNCIDSRMVRKVRPVYYVRAAAFLAIAMSVSVLAYKWSGRTIQETGNGTLALNEESSVLYGTIPMAPEIRVTSMTMLKTTPAAQPATAVLTTVNQADNGPMINMSALHLPGKTLTLKGTTGNLGLVKKTVAAPAPLSDVLAADAVAKEYQDYLASDLNSEIPVQPSPKWSIAALASPTYNGKINQGSSELATQLASSEEAALSYTGGLTVSYNLNKRLSIQSGIFYSSVGQQVSGINSFAGFRKYDKTKGDHNFQVKTTRGTITTTNADVFLFADGNSNRIVTAYNRDVFDPQKASLDYINNTMKQSFSYLELPVFLRYKVIDRTVDFNLIGGLSYNFLVDNSVYTVVDGNKYLIGTTEGMNTFSVSSSFGMGMEYKFSGKLSLNLEPTFRYYLNTLGASSGSQYHPYSFGIFSGISYRF
jgi:hypothetical protein